MTINKKNISRYAYPDKNGGRDLRLDFLRGLIMLVVITVHMEYYSFFSLFVWERVGLVSSAEGFVGLSGIVLGLVYRRRLSREGFKRSAIKLWTRSFQLYRINLFVILSIALLRVLPFIDVFDVINWVPVDDKNKVYPLYPPASTPWFEVIREALLLKIGPHQFQVIGLYVVLIGIAPFILYLLHRNKTTWLVIATVVLYWINDHYYFRVTGARFELGFPTLTWQLLFINGIVVGYHHEKILGSILDPKNKAVILFSAFLSLAFLLFALNNRYAVFWPWREWALIEGVVFGDIYREWFLKSSLGVGRIVNNIVLFIISYYCLTHYWQPINKVLGWLLIPLGQASLYVFILHVYFIIFFSNLAPKGYNSFWIGTAIHTVTILLIWIMVKYRVLFRVIPR